MSTYFWNDPYVETCNPHEKLVYSYLCFNQNDNNAGIYLVSRGTISGETGLPIQEVIDILNKFEKDGKIMYKDNVIAIKNRIKNQNIKNTPIRLSIFKVLAKAPRWAVEFVDIDFLCEIQGINRESLMTHEGDPSVQDKDKGKDKGKDKDKDKSNSSFSALKYFIDEYLKNLKTKYIPSNPKKDGRLLKLIITNHGVDNYKLALSRYWSKKDNFITSRKYDVTAFNSVVGILLTGSVVSKNGQKTADEVMREMRLK
jgi:hypothetical protein